jgi:hypothetical protein
MGADPTLDAYYREFAERQRRIGLDEDALRRPAATHNEPASWARSPKDPDPTSYHPSSWGGH